MERVTILPRLSSTDYRVNIHKTAKIGSNLKAPKLND